ncbi:MAG: MarR family transcriptional regulator [Lachnospiraceae bacterium]|nr:MarR family transcriptional regulator [Muribaculum sp.]MCM1409898.1 MarR family transcriptional regulator [Lachnospiraceae bacterium]
MSIDKEVQAFGSTQHDISAAYEEYARSKGLSYTTFYIMNIIACTKGCTQNQICRHTFLPRQTVNSVIKTLLEAGYIELKQRETDKRTKEILYTEKGLSYIQTIIPQIQEAEFQALQMLGDTERTILVKAAKKYAENFRKILMQM